MLRRIVFAMFFVGFAAVVAAPSANAQCGVPQGGCDPCCENEQQAICNQRHQQCGSNCTNPQTVLLCLIRCDESYIQCWDQVDDRCCFMASNPTPRAVAVVAAKSILDIIFEPACNNAICMDSCERGCTTTHTNCVTNCGSGSQAGPCIDRCNGRYPLCVDECPFHCCQWASVGCAAPPMAVS